MRTAVVGLGVAACIPPTPSTPDAGANEAADSGAATIDGGDLTDAPECRPRSDYPIQGCVAVSEDAAWLEEQLLDGPVTFTGAITASGSGSAPVDCFDGSFVLGRGLDSTGIDLVWVEIDDGSTVWTISLALDPRFSRPEIGDVETVVLRNTRFVSGSDALLRIFDDAGTRLLFIDSSTLEGTDDIQLSYGRVLCTEQTACGETAHHAVHASIGDDAAEVGVGELTQVGPFIVINSAHGLPVGTSSCADAAGPFARIAIARIEP